MNDVYNCTALAPEARSFQTCADVEIPPQAIIPIFPCVIACTSAIINSVFSNNGSPLNPPRPTFNRLLSIGRVFATINPSTPASIAVSANFNISLRSSSPRDHGGSFTNNGTVFSFAKPSINPLNLPVSWNIRSPTVLGLLILSSIPVAIDCTRWKQSKISSSIVPAILTKIRFLYR